MELGRLLDDLSPYYGVVTAKLGKALGLAYDEEKGVFGGGGAGREYGDHKTGYVQVGRDKPAEEPARAKKTFSPGSWLIRSKSRKNLENTSPARILLPF